MTCIYVRYNNLKKTGQLRNVWVEFGFGTVCGPSEISEPSQIKKHSKTSEPRKTSEPKHLKERFKGTCSNCSWVSKSQPFYQRAFRHHVSRGLSTRRTRRMKSTLGSSGPRPRRP